MGRSFSPEKGLEDWGPGRAVHRLSPYLEFDSKPLSKLCICIFYGPPSHSVKCELSFWLPKPRRLARPPCSAWRPSPSLKLCSCGTQMGPVPATLYPLHSSLYPPRDPSSKAKDRNSDHISFLGSQAGDMPPASTAGETRGLGRPHKGWHTSST